MKKFLLSLFVILTFIAYVIHKRTEEGDANIVVPANTSPTENSHANPIISSQQYRDGTYTGDVADAFYGPMQVRALIKNGRISDVEFLQYPHDRQTSIEISRQSMPILAQEAIRSQRAKVDIVSGATQTSDAFVQSLQSALD